MNKGNQKPRIDIYHDGDISLAEKTIALWEAYNKPLLPWQKSIVRRWMAIGEDGKWANQNAGLIVSRQNGKTETSICRILGGMIFMGEHLIYTAHQNSTVDEIKRRVLRFFYDAEPEIRDLLTSEFDKEPKSFDYIELRNGGRCIFRTRTRSSGLGFTSDAIINDECFLADTIVDGKRIQDIRVGDMVRSLNKYGEIEYRRVTRLIKKPRPQVLTSLKIGDKELVSTGNHRHLTQRGWVRAEDIKPGDYLQYLGTKAARCQEGCRFRAIRVDGIAIQKRTNLDRAGLSDGGNYVYCIDVEENHNFIANGFITHNCQEQNDAQEEALLPTISAGPLKNPQVIMMGTPPTAGSTGTVFLRSRRNLLQGKADICWQEWSVENITDNHDVDAWYQTNPSLGYIITEKAIRAEANAMSQDSFNKMRLGWIPGVDAQRVFTDDEWNALAIKEVKLPEDPQLVYAVKFAPDRSAVTLAVGVIMGDKTHVEVIERKRMSDGMAWLVRWLLDRWRKASCIVIDGAAGQGLLVEELLRSEPRIKKRLLTPNVKEAGSAYAAFYQAIQDKTLTHYNQPLLNSAVRTAKRRDIGKDGMFGYAPLNPSIQMDPVDAVAFALYAVRRFENKRKGSGKQVFRAF